VERDSNTIITGSFDGTLKEWNKVSCECLGTHLETAPLAFRNMVKTRNGFSIVYGTWSGDVHFRRVSDLKVTLSFQLKGTSIDGVVELGDGSFLSRTSQELLIWNDRGEVLHTFTIDNNLVNSNDKELLYDAIELTSDLIVISSSSVLYSRKLSVWRVSTSEVSTVGYHEHPVGAMVKLSKDRFASVGFYGQVKVWSVKRGKCIETYDNLLFANAVARLKNGSVVFAGSGCLQVLHRRV